MDDPIRFTKLPLSTTIKQATTPDNSATPSTDKKKTQTGITSSKDSFEVKQQNPLFTANPNTGEVNFGSGLSGKRPPVGTQNITTSANKFEELLQESKAEISSYLKGTGGTASSETAQHFRAVEEYLKLTQVESGEYNKMNRASKEMSMLAAENKINLDNEKIDQQMKEAGEKAKIAMEQATTALISGVVGGALSIAEAAAQLKDMASKAKGDLLHGKSDAQIESRYQHFTSLLNDLEKVENSSNEFRKSGPLTPASNLKDSQVKSLEDAADKADSFAKDSGDHRDRIRDAVIDFLNKLRDMNPQI